jgi:hypothetical protein
LATAGQVAEGLILEQIDWQQQDPPANDSQSEKGAQSLVHTFPLPKNKSIP